MNYYLVQLSMVRWQKCQQRNYPKMRELIKVKTLAKIFQDVIFQWTHGIFGMVGLFEILLPMWFQVWWALWHFSTFSYESCFVENFIWRKRLKAKWKEFYNSRNERNHISVQFVMLAFGFWDDSKSLKVFFKLQML